MTEYWVSQGNKWCDFCKIWIQNNALSIRNHELGKRHRENVNKKLVDMREKSAAKDKELKDAEKALQQIEAKATRSYQKDVATIHRAAKANALPDDGWQYEKSSGYYYNETSGLYYDSNSGFYYSNSIGKWVTQEEAYASISDSSDARPKRPVLNVPMSNSRLGTSLPKSGTEPASGRVVSTHLNPTRQIKGKPSSLDLGKRKRQEEKPKKLSVEEKAALKAREAARKRVEAREKPLFGLYDKKI